MEFKPPKINKFKSETTVSELIVLDRLNKFQISVNDIHRKLTGGYVEYALDFSSNYRIKGEPIISKLLKKGMVRESFSLEVLKHLTNPELKQILKYYKLSTTGIKSELVERIEKHLNNEEIDKVISKAFFIVNKSGMDLLKKYQNVIWINEHGGSLRSFKIDSEPKFDENYFIEHWDVNPIEVMLNYYESKSSSVTARLFYLQGNLEQAFVYKLKEMTEMFIAEVEKCKVGGTMSYLFIKGNYFREDIVHIYNQIDRIDEENLSEILRYCYDFVFNDEKQFTFSVYKNIILPVIEGRDEVESVYYDKISADIREAHGYNRDVIISDYDLLTGYSSNVYSEENQLEDELDCFFMNDEDMRIEIIFKVLEKYNEIADWETLNKIKKKIEELFSGC